VTPFQEFRLWSRRAPRSQRLYAGAAAAAALALLAWLILPADAGSHALTSGLEPATQPDQTTVQHVGGSRQGPPTAARSGAPAAGAAVGPGGATASGGHTTSHVGAKPVSPARARCAPETDTGASATQLKVAITLLELKGSTANGAFGIPTADEQKAMARAVIDSINSSGGVACRRLLPVFYTGDATDSNQLQQTCQDIAGAGVFAVIDLGAYTSFTSLAACYAQRHIPFFEISGMPRSLTDKYYPYIFGGMTLETLYRDTVLALAARGFFDTAKGFNKLGYFYSSCNPGLVAYYTKLLTQVVSSSKIVGYDMGCSSPFAPPSTIQQAVLKFQQNNVTHVTEVQDFADWINFTNIAQQQGFKPRYGIPDENTLANGMSGPSHPNYENIANTIAITAFRDGEQFTPGNKPTPGTARCNAIMSAHHLPTAYEGAGVPGGVCGLLFWFADAANHAPSVHRNALSDGLRVTGAIDFPFPLGVGDFRGPRETNGGEYWRPIQFVSSCNCFHVVGPFRGSL
jgi:ABC-type branched-subunit amino acid transport system substrate-binding protein